MTQFLGHYFARLERIQPWRWRGHVVESVGQTIESAGPLASVGECCEIVDSLGDAHAAEVIGFRGSNVLSMPVESTEGILKKPCAPSVRHDLVAPLSNLCSSGAWPSRCSIHPNTFGPLN